MVSLHVCVRGGRPAELDGERRAERPGRIVSARNGVCLRGWRLRAASAAAVDIAAPAQLRLIELQQHAAPQQLRLIELQQHAAPQQL